MATTQSGLLFSWGLNVYGELGLGSNSDQDKPKQVEALQIYCVVKMSAGRSHSAIVTECGKLFTWGHNPDGRLLKPVVKYNKSSRTKNYYLP